MEDVDLPDYVRKQALKEPQWAMRGRVHDWRNHISPRLRAIWSGFTDEQKLAIAEQAEREASAEHWD